MATMVQSSLTMATLVIIARVDSSDNYSYPDAICDLTISIHRLLNTFFGNKSIFF